jgi:hypothetical protein
MWEKGWWPYVIVLIAVFAAYANVYGNEFLYDDTHLIVENAFLRSWQNWPKLFSSFLGAGDNTLSRYYRPLQSLAYLGVFQIAGLSTAAYHLLNVGLHAANACLLVRLGRGLGFHPLAVLLAALVWAVHPVNVEAVTYMSATADTLYSFFCLAGLVVLLPDASRKRIVAACPFLVAGLLGKESAIAFPLLAATLIYFQSDRRFDPRAYIRLWPLAMIAVVYVGLHFVFSPAEHATGAVSGLINRHRDELSPFAVMPFYARLMLWPMGLFMEHDLILSGFAAMAYSVAGFVLIVAAGLLVAKPQSKASLAASWGLLWFFCAYFPSGVPSGIVYEHWLYLPMAGLFLGIAQCLLIRLRGRLRMTVPVGVAMLAGGLGWLTWQQNAIWHDPVRFYTTIIEHGGPAPKAHTNLALAYMLKTDYSQALAEYDLAFAGYAQLPDPQNEAVAHNGAAMTLMKMPEHTARQSDVLAHLQRALALDPDSYLTLANLAEFFVQQGDDQRARYYRVRAAEQRQRFGP